MSKRTPKIRSITVIGRRWFQRGPGNVYCTATVLVNGAAVAKVGPTYGYGDHYETLAFEWLTGNGYISSEREPLWRYCENNRIAYYREAADVAREKDL